MIENKKDEKIKNLLENLNTIKAIKVDFQDLNNKTLIIKSSFKEGYKHLDDEDKKEKWYYIAEMNPYTFDIYIEGLVAFDINPENNYLNLYWIETNAVKKKQGITKKIIDYLKEYCKYLHLKGILAKCLTSDDIYIFKKFGFEHKCNSLITKWDV